jgi:phenylalanyl-tRNA synthetase beta chain
MKQRLSAVGVRSISLPIDITNYVFLEVGVPLHSFDADAIQGDIHFRKAKKGETILTLDGVQRTLSSGALVLSDDKGIFDLLGIMGDLRSSTKPETKRIFLQSPAVDPQSIRKTIIATGHRTDAATVFEKGVPPVNVERSFLRAIELFLMLVPGAKIISKMESWGENGKTKPITLTTKRLHRLLGAPIELPKAAKILRDLGFAVEEKKTALRVSPPLWRLRDIKSEHDLIEEVGRIYGYDAIPSDLPKAELIPPPRDHRLLKLRTMLKEEGYTELVPLSLTSSAIIAKTGLDPARAVSIENPLGEDTRYLQPHILPGLLENAQRNMNVVERELLTFASGHIFSKQDGERTALTILRADLKDSDDLKTNPFLLLKRDIETALTALHYSPAWVRDNVLPPFAHPGRAAHIIIDGKDIGHIEELHPSIRQNFGLPHRAATATINLTTLLGMAPVLNTAVPLPLFPAITYDITVTRTQKEKTKDLLAKLKTASPLLESVEIVDLYSGKPLAESGSSDPRSFNLTLRFTYRAPDRTLTEDEAKKEQEKISKLLA